ncbi:MAG: hypothetical protein KJN84_10355, partial [Bacteroidia bacterium]|nr:hypothetical protein [Bacteroidia bacterium]
MKTSLLCLISFLFISINLIAQHEFCGALPPAKALGSNQDDLYFDRFGNSYDLYIDDNVSQFKNSGGSRCFGLTDPYNTINIGYFELRIYFSTPSEYIPIIENVTRYFSTLISQNNLCHSSEPDPVIIQISACDLENPNVVAAGSPFYQIANNTQRCGNVNYARLVSVIESTIQTGQNLIDSPIYSNPSGCIAFNSETTASIYTGTGSLPAGMTDFTNVVMHEFMHVLGFASIAAAQGSLRNHVSTFDMKMELVSDYDATGNQMSTPLFPLENCTGNSSCIVAALNPSSLETLVNENCMIGNQTIVLGSGTAPISGGTTNTENEFLNAMSHLSNKCDDEGSHRFIMTPNADDYRDLSSQELEILKSLGYTVNGQENCFLIGNNEFNFDNDENSCCPNPFQDFTICIGETIAINIDDLLCNDFTNDSNGVELIGTPSFQNNQINGSITRDENLLNVTINQVPIVNGKGSIEAHINYNISACECEILTRRFTVNIIVCDDCSNIDPCENLLCNDISGLPAITGGGFGLNNNFFILNDQVLLNNTPDFVTTSDDRTLYRIASSSYRESVSLPLYESINPGCGLEMNIDAYGVIGDALLNIYGSEFPPCHYSHALTNDEGRTTDCDGYTFEPLISTQISVTHATDNLLITDVVLPSSDPIFINISNISDRPINYITFIPEISQNQSFIIFDLIDVTRNCQLQ